MSNKTLGIGIAIIVLGAIGTAGAIRIAQNSKHMDEQASNQEKAAAGSNSQNNTNTSGDNNTTTKPDTNQQATATSRDCARNFDQNKLKIVQVDVANKFVTLNVNNFGSIKIQFYYKDAPKTVENFLRLTNAGYYDCLTFHRVAKGFVIQSGDPTGTGSGGDSAFGGAFADELNADTASYKAGYLKGVVAMANKGPNTNSSQFFIMLSDAQLPHNYTIFGTVVAGQDVVDKIGAVDIIPQLGPTDGAPKTPVVIKQATITSK